MVAGDEPELDLRLLVVLEEMLLAETVADRDWDTAAQDAHRAQQPWARGMALWEPASFNDVAGPLARFALETARRFPQDAGHPLYGELAEALARAAMRNDVGPEAPPPVRGPPVARARGPGVGARRRRRGVGGAARSRRRKSNNGATRNGPSQAPTACGQRK